LTSPILFLIFNRPDTTTIVFESIRAAQPPRLYVAADGTRKSKEGEEEICSQVRQIATQVDWPCEVKTLFRDTNLGCGKAVSEAITWFFKHEEMGIILEDDCLADQSFYGFCDVLLDKYKNEKSVMHIGGTNFQPTGTLFEDSYYFSMYSHVWGWASWRDRWTKYDFFLESFDLSQALDQYGQTSKVKKYFGKRLSQVKSGVINTWDYQWVMSIWRYHGLCITPNINLVSNIGFNEQATHTTSNMRWAKVTTSPIDTINHPSITERSTKKDDYTFHEVYYKPSRIVEKIKNKIKSVLR